MEESTETSCRTNCWHHSAWRQEAQGTEGGCDKSRKESSVSATVLSIPRVFSAQDILYPPSNNCKSIRFQSFLIRSSPGRLFLSFFFPSVIIWRFQKIGEELSPHIFSISVPKHSRFDVLVKWVMRSALHFCAWTSSGTK